MGETPGERRRNRRQHRSLLDHLEQVTYWNGERLRSMEPEHKRNLLAWLMKHADSLKTAEENRFMSGPMPSGDAATDGFDDVMGELLDKDSHEWLDEKPLVVRLRELIRADGAK